MKPLESQPYTSDMQAITSISAIDLDDNKNLETSQKTAPSESQIPDRLSEDEENESHHRLRVKP